MLWLYNIGIALYGMLIRFAAAFNPKARLFLKGRQHVFSGLSGIDHSHKTVWFHFASLGEFEQGRPVMESIKANYPDKQLIVTFFSPSGYEIRKDYALAAGVFYLPLDTARNARQFISLVQPEIAIFTKYEFWYHYFRVLQENHIPLLLISSIFRPDQVFFKWYGGFQRGILHMVTHFFVQNEQSAALLQDLGITQLSLSGDTRFDRVAEHAENPKQLGTIAAFCGNAKVWIAGSTWPKDEQLLVTLIALYPDWKFIIAPHEVDEAHLQKLSELFPGALRYTACAGQTGQFSARVMLVDTIGLLSSVYQYGNIAYIGGGFGAGIHNTLEAAAFGLPVIFGPAYHKFQEAGELIAAGAAISISDASELAAAAARLDQDQQAGPAAKKYVRQKTGSTGQIIKFLQAYLS